MNTLFIDNYKIEVINEKCYNSGSKDNANTYQFEYGYQDGKEISSGSHVYGLRLYVEEIEYSSAILCGKGWAGSFNEKFMSIDYSEVVILVGSSVFCLELPGLNLKWKVDGEWITGLELCKVKSGYVIHGESSIAKVSFEGKLEWEFYGRDIFVLPSGEDNFNIKDECIEVVDWEGYIYKIAMNGKETTEK